MLARMKPGATAAAAGLTILALVAWAGPARAGTSYGIGYNEISSANRTTLLDPATGMSSQFLSGEDPQHVPRLLVGAETRTDPVRLNDAILKFRLDRLPADADIFGAILDLTVEFGGPIAGGGSVGLRISAFGAAGPEIGLADFSIPGVDVAHEGPFTLDQADVRLNNISSPALTDLVRSIHASGQGYVGFHLSLEGTATSSLISLYGAGDPEGYYLFLPTLDVGYTSAQLDAVPEPGSATLTGLGLLGGVGVGLRCRRRPPARRVPAFPLCLGLHGAR